MIDNKELASLLKATGLLILLTLSGGYLLSVVEGIQFSDSLYYTFLLITTVTEYPAKTALGRVIASIILIFGLGLIFYVASIITKILMATKIEEYIGKIFNK